MLVNFNEHEFKYIKLEIDCFCHIDIDSNGMVIDSMEHFFA